jgi:hypothetical protein
MVKAVLTGAAAYFSFQGKIVHWALYFLPETTTAIKL